MPFAQEPKFLCIFNLDLIDMLNPNPGYFKSGHHTLHLLSASPVSTATFCLPATGGPSRCSASSRSTRRLCGYPDDVLLVTTSSDGRAAGSRDAAPVGL